MEAKNYGGLGKYSLYCAFVVDDRWEGRNLSYSTLSLCWDKGGRRGLEA